MPVPGQQGHLEEAAALGLPEPRIDTPEGFVAVTLLLSPGQS